MDHNSEMAYSEQGQMDSMVSAPDADFANLFDLDDINLDFPMLGDSGASSQQDNQQLSELANTLDMQHLRPSATSVSQPENRFEASHSQSLEDANRMIEPANNIFDFSFQPSYGQQQAQPQHPYALAQNNAFHPHGVVPPTPNSIEMHPDQARYLQQVDAQNRALLEQQYRMRKDDVASFTPLVSPAVTPHESRFAIPPEYTAPGSYFSPLASPALEAQNQRQYHHDPRTSSSSISPSPVDPDVDMLGESAVPQTDTGRKTRQRKNPPRSAGPSARIRQSPIVKPNRRKATLSAGIQPKEVNDLLEQARPPGQRSRPTSSGLAFPQAHDSSEAESISPEPLSETIMRPPPRPGSVSQSPSIQAKNAGSSSTQDNGMCPATPASIMRIQSSPSQVSPQTSALPATSESVPQTPLDDLVLPEAASTSRPELSRLDTVVAEGDVTPRLPARKTPKLGPLSTPGSALPATTKPSPAVSTVASPTSVGSKAPASRPESKGGRGKKRNSGSSTLVSPALRPKISPNIKPLLPGKEGALTDETHALLLASKSNYQHILDGTTLPGVNYPEALSNNLTSKRTSHKIAEQGRRQRINTAIQIMQGLLPSPKVPLELKSPEITPSGTEKEKGERSTGNSKAATVEQAIEYIRQLQKDVQEKDRIAKEREREVEELRRRLSLLEKDEGPPKDDEPGAEIAETKEGDGEEKAGDPKDGSSS